MSWVDLAALTIVLWSAAKGYIHGVWNTAVHFFITVLALPLAFFFHKPLVVFLNQQWKIEAYFVGWMNRYAQNVLPTTQTGGQEFILPPAAAPLLPLFLPEAAALPVMTRESLVVLLGTLLLRLAAFTVFVFFIVVFVRYFLRVCQVDGKKPAASEGQRLWGFAFGVGHGIALALLICITVDALCLVFSPGFWDADFHSSYLARIASYCLAFCL